MALLGADNLGKNGKQNLNPDGTPNSLSRSTAFNYQALGPGFHGVGGMSGDTPENLARARANEAAKVTPTVVPKPVAGPGAGYPGVTGPAPQPSKPFKKDAIDPVLSHADDATDAIGRSFNQSFVNTARDIKKNPVGAIQSRAINSVLDIGNAIANTGANLSNAEFNTNLPNVSLPKIEGNVPTPDSIVRGVYDSVKRGDGVSAQFLPRVKGGSLQRDVKKGTAWSGGLYVPGDGMETFKRVADAAAAVPVVGKGAKLAAGVADRAIADSIVVNAADKAPIETVTAAGRRPVRPGSKPPNSVTVRQGKTKEAVSAEEKAAADRQALLESTAPSQDLLDAHGAIEMKHGPEITHGTYNHPTDAVSRAGIFHGTASPEAPTIEQGQQAWIRNIAGGNFFTTDSASTAKSYTSGGTERIRNLAPSTDRVYRIDGAEGKKFLDLNSHGKTIAEQDPELFQAIHDEIAKINPADAEKFKVMDGGGGNTRAITKKHNANDNTSPIDDEEPNYYNEERINFFNVGSPYNGILRKHALERGYHGFTHDGGRLSGDGGHQVLAFWDTVGLTARRSNALERSAPSIDDIKGEISERKFRREREIERIRRSRQWTKEDQDRFG